MTATGTVLNPIIFQKSGTGDNPKITAFSGTESQLSDTPDGIWSFQGCDYVTIDGIDLYDPYSGTIPNGTSSMEYGYGLFRNNAYDGAQYNTIKNCTISLYRNNDADGDLPMPDGSSCILVINSTPTNATTDFAPFAPSGTNSYNKFYSNVLQNSNNGIYLTGSVAAFPYDLGDNGNDVGGSMASTGNTILNFGGNGDYNGTYTNPKYGICALYQWSLNICYNTLNNNNGSGSNPHGAIYGIAAHSATSSNVDINYNSITLKSADGDYSVVALQNSNGNTASANTVNITHNTISNCTSLGNFHGISNSSNATIVNITNNTISNITNNSKDGRECVLIRSDATNLNINDNIIHSITKIRATGTGSDNGQYLYCIWGSGQNTVYQNNTIENITNTANFSNLTYGDFRGIYSEGINETMTGNILRDITMIAFSHALIWNGIKSVNSGTKLIQNNQIYNINVSTCSPNTDIYGISASGQISNNQVHDIQISGSFSTLGSSIICGIAATSAGTIINNQIYNLEITGINSCTLTGISAVSNHPVSICRNNITNLKGNNEASGIEGIRSEMGTKNVYNNFISDLATPYATSTTAIAGIKINNQGTSNVYNNSVFLNASSTGATFGSSAIYVYPSNVVDLRNNNFINISIPNGGGYTCAYRRSSNFLSTYSNLSNNNNFYAGSPGLYRLIYSDGTNSDQTLSTFKARVSPRDGFSVTEIPPFINTSIQPYDLHLSPIIPTQCESQGTRITSPIAVTDDLDSDIRWGEPGYTGTGVAPDIGADEGNFVLLECTPPVITYTALSNSCSTGDRLLTTIITDLTGLPVTGAYVPRIYYKKNSGTWFSQPGNMISGTAYNGIWTFSIVTTDLGGVISGDIIYYYVIAQDIKVPPNIGSNPGNGLVASSVTSVSTPPANPSSYSILNLLTGTIQVGVGKTFATLTEAAAAYNSSSYCIDGNIVFELTDANYSIAETFPVTFNANLLAGPSSTLTIRPATGVSPVISGTNFSAIIKFNNAKYITIDGSYSGGTDRNLTISNLAESGTISTVMVGSTGTGSGSTFITIKNCNISSTTHPLTTSYGIIAGASSSVGTAGSDNDNLNIINNNIYKVHIGIGIIGTSTGKDDNLQIVNNTIGETNSDNFVIMRGLSLAQVFGAQITGNTIFNIESGGTPIGMHIGDGVVSSTFEKNSINNVKYTGSGVLGGRGIYVNTGVTNSDLCFTNNIIYGILGIGNTGPTSNHGIVIDGTTGGINLYFNSVYLSGTNNPYISVITSAIFINTLVTNLDIRNNIFQNSQINGSGNYSYAIYSAASSTAFSNINYNNYWVTGTYGILGYLGSNKSNLSSWQAATGKDANSLYADPLFISTFDLRPGLGSPVVGSGLTISGINSDYLGVARNSLPSIGAFENAIDAAGPTITYAQLPNTGSLTGSTLIATITDLSGMPVSGSGLPVLYWKKNSGGWIPVVAIVVGSNQYQFSFGAGAPGDTIYYYVIAQDLCSPVPNVSCSPLEGAAGFTSNPPATITPPSIPNSYRILSIINGTVIIGSTGDYSNLTGTNGLFKAINNNLVSGNIVALISEDLIEDGSNALNQWTEFGGSNYTLTIMPLDKNDRLISGTPITNQGLIVLNGADRVTITGMYFGDGPFLTFRNLSSSYPLIQIANDASFDTISDCTLESGGTSSVVFFNSTAGNHNNVISNCVIRDRTDISLYPQYGISVTGSNISNYNISLTGNKICNFTRYGIYLANSSGNGYNWSITNNHFYNSQSTAPSTSQAGIYINAGSSCTGNLISGNYIGGQTNNCGGGPWINSGAITFYGIYINGGASGGTSIQSNTIKNINLTSTGSSSFFGINSYTGTNLIGTVTGNMIGDTGALGNITIAGTGNVYGIYVYNTTNTSRNNSIINIKQTSALPGNFYGFYLVGNYQMSIEANYIKLCGPTSTATNNKDVIGICFAGAALGTQNCTIVNNLISLGHGYSNNSIYKGIDDYGYSGNNLFLYYNSIYLGGTATGSSNSYAYLKRDVTNEIHKNNIYYNSRTGGTGVHYAIGNTKITSGTLTGNYNDLYSAGTVLAIWNTLNQTDIAAWRTASGQDVNSKSVNPLYNSTTNLHPTSPDLDAAGTSIPGITTDYSGALRGNPPDIGAFEFILGPTVWNGSASNEWNNPLNWTPNSVPSSGTSVTIPSGTTNSCVISTNVMSCNDLTVDGTSLTIVAGGILTVYGNLILINNALFSNNGTLNVIGSIIN